MAAAAVLKSRLRSRLPTSQRRFHSRRLIPSSTLWRPRAHPMALDNFFILDLTISMRKIISSDQGPLEIKPQDKSVWICMCGLTRNQPYCDGSHKMTRDEAAGKTYLYDEDGHRQEID